MGQGRPSHRSHRHPPHRRGPRAGRARRAPPGRPRVRSRAHEPACRAQPRPAGSPGSASQSETSDDLLEWDYGDYEGKRTVDIRVDRPGWTLWADGVPGGETASQVGARADEVIARALAAPGDVLLFAHGHLLRVLGARWLDLEPTAGRLFALSPATLSVLGFERENRVFQRWNDICDSVAGALPSMGDGE